MEKNSKKFYFTVKELIEILNELPPDLPVLTSGYEDGFENFHQPSIIKVKHLPGNPYYDGEFQISDDGDDVVFEAVVLQRVMRNI
jgi:hypothetical protein